MSTATITDRSVETSGENNRLTETLEERLSHPATSPDFDLKKGVNDEAEAIKKQVARTKV
jgi:hypothetical protein